MTQEDKRLLLQDLCSRLLYGVICKVEDTQEPVKLKGITPDRDKPLEIYDDGEEKSSTYYYTDEVKPYLRPMSSMTDEEKATMDKIWTDNNKLVFADPDDIRRYRFYDISIVDFLNKHHFDYRGLIEKGLALEAPKDMYKF